MMKGQKAGCFYTLSTAGAWEQSDGRVATCCMISLMRDFVNFGVKLDLVSLGVQISLFKWTGQL